MRCLHLIMLAALLGPAIVSAKEFKLTVGKQMVSLDLADAWKPELITRGLQAQTADGEVYLSVEATADTKEMGTIIDESDAMLKSHKVALARGSRQGRKFTVNGYPAEELLYTGRDEDGPVTVSFTFVTIHDAAVVFTYWASAEGDKQHRHDFGKIVDSLKTLPAMAKSIP